MAAAGGLRRPWPIRTGGHIRSRAIGFTPRSAGTWDSNYLGRGGVPPWALVKGQGHLGLGARQRLGARPGCAGVRPKATWVGRLCRRQRSSRPGAACNSMAPRPVMRALGLGRRHSPSWVAMISGAVTWPLPCCPLRKAAEVFKNSTVRNGYHSVNRVFAVEGIGRGRIAAVTHRDVSVETPTAPGFGVSRGEKVNAEKLKR